MTDEPKLKPCPFCGSNKITVTGEGEFLIKSEKMKVWITCNKCEYKGNVCGSYESAVEDWNLWNDQKT